MEIERSIKSFSNTSIIPYKMLITDDVLSTNVAKIFLTKQTKNFVSI